MSDLLFRALDRKDPLRFQIFDRAFALRAGHGLFSADRLDDGTRLLLDTLPENTPSSVFDLGCGVGALGIPIATRFPNAQVTMVDRDALAVAYAKRNAQARGLSNTSTFASIGFDAVPVDAQYDWILSNIPARIGGRAIERFIVDGHARLSPNGSLRFVVIRDLEHTVASVAKEIGAHATEVAKSRQHTVIEIAAERVHRRGADDTYVRDEVEFANRQWLRFTDASEVPELLRDGVPLLCELLPREMQGKRALVVRGGWGHSAVTLAERGAEVVASDRDLLALDFTRRNAERANVVFKTHAAAWAWDAYSTPAFDAIVVLASETLGEHAASIETTLARKALLPHGAILTLGRDKFYSKSLENLRDKPKLIAKRGAFGVWRDEPR